MILKKLFLILEYKNDMKNIKKYFLIKKLK
jgi:hypothetical protein